MPTPRHISEVVRAMQGTARQGGSEVSISGQLTDPTRWVSGTIESSRGDLANRYEVSLPDGPAVTATSVLDGTSLTVGDGVWLVLANGRMLIVGVR